MSWIALIGILAPQRIRTKRQGYANWGSTYDVHIVLDQDGE